MFRLPVKQIEEFMCAVLHKIGIPSEDAKVCAEVLIASDLSGIESHGIGRLKMYYDRIRSGIQNPLTKIDIIKDNHAVAVWDGNHGMGQVIGKRAMQAAIDKAAKYGLGAVAVRNSTHYGICGFYAQMATKQDMLGLTFTNARPSVCPTFGVQPLLGTNPICFGAPTDLGFPFIYDAATSISQRGKIEQLGREGKETPEGWAIDLDGNPHTRTPELLQDLIKQTASLLPIGGTDELSGSHKGYGLSTMVEILCAALSGGSFLNLLLGVDALGKPAPYCLGHFFMAINIESFIDLQSFKTTSGEICRQLINSKKLPGHDRIYVAGEKEHEMQLKIQKEGIPIIPNLKKAMMTMQDELSLKLIDF